MIVGVRRESFPGERRVALVPGVIPNLAKAGLEVVIEAGAGVEAGYPDADYVSKGAKVLASRGDVNLGGCGDDRHAASHLEVRSISRHRHHPVRDTSTSGRPGYTR